jgi:hypothetical protein
MSILTAFQKLHSKNFYLKGVLLLLNSYSFSRSLERVDKTNKVYRQLGVSKNPNARPCLAP